MKDKANIKQTGERLYKRYGKQLEKKHWGKYIAISPTGKTIIAPTLYEVSEKALEKFGRGNFVFKIGEIAVGDWL